MNFLVQHHPARAGLLPELLRGIPGARVVTDPDPGGQPDPWRTYRECLLLAAELEGPTTIVQDDVTLCDGFAEIAPVAAAVNPDALTAFYIQWWGQSGNFAKQASGQDRRFTLIAKHEWVPVVATCWPVGAPQECLSWLAEKPGAVTRADDGTVARWIRKSPRRAVGTVPCLVDHLDETPSLIHRSTKDKPGRRRAAVPWAVMGDPAELVWQ